MNTQYNHSPHYQVFIKRQNIEKAWRAGMLQTSALTGKSPLIYKRAFWVEAV